MIKDWTKEQTYKEEFDKLKEIVDDFVTYFGDTIKDDSEDELDLNVEVMLSAMTVAIELDKLQKNIDDLFETFM